MSELRRERASRWWTTSRTSPPSRRQPHLIRPKRRVRRGGGGGCRGEAAVEGNGDSRVSPGGVKGNTRCASKLKEMGAIHLLKRREERGQPCGSGSGRRPGDRPPAGEGLLHRAGRPGESRREGSRRARCRSGTSSRIFDDDSTEEEVEGASARQGSARSFQRIRKKPTSPRSRSSSASG